METKTPLYVVLPVVADVFGVSIAALKGQDRTRPVVLTRWAYWMLVREFFPSVSLPRLGGLLNKDHTSARGGLKKIERYMECNPEYRDRIETARQTIAQWRPTASSEPVCMVRAAPLAKISKTPPVVNSVTPSAVARPSDFDDWFRASLKNSEDRFLALMAEEYPDRVRVPVKEAAE